MPATVLSASLLNPESIISSFGGFALLGVCLILFAECGLLIGFFLPGDSLLFTTGLLIASGTIRTSLWLTCILVSVAAVLGNLCGYWIGRKAGPALFDKPDSRLFRPEYVQKTHDFFEKYGSRAIVLARFVPIVRTFITATAGMGGMSFRRFATYSAIGGVLWGVGVTVLGYFLGQMPFVKNNIDLMLVGIVALSVVPIGIELLRARRQGGEAQVTSL